MFDIYGVPPNQEREVHITSRHTKVDAERFAANLAGFGYTRVRIADGNAPPAVVPLPAPVPASPLPAPEPVTPPPSTVETPAIKEKEAGKPKT